MKYAALSRGPLLPPNCDDQPRIWLRILCAALMRIARNHLDLELLREKLQKGERADARDSFGARLPPPIFALQT